MKFFFQVSKYFSRFLLKTPCSSRFSRFAWFFQVEWEPWELDSTGQNLFPSEDGGSTQQNQNWTVDLRSCDSDWKPPRWVCGLNMTCLCSARNTNHSSGQQNHQPHTNLILWLSRTENKLGWTGMQAKAVLHPDRIVAHGKDIITDKFLACFENKMTQFPSRTNVKTM